jgi:RimJ/RimL family protein N-acetyltransferase
VTRLEPYSPAHLDGVAALVRDPDTVRFTRIPEPPPEDFARTWMSAYEVGRADGTREAFVALDRDGRFLGLGLAPHVDRAAGEIELGYAVAAEARGRGVGVAILRALTEWALAEGALRMTLIIQVGNLASETVAERCGYVLEGVMRSLYVKPGVRADSGLWSRLASDR